MGRNIKIGTIDIPGILNYDKSMMKNEDNQIRPIPYGVSDFAYIRQRNYYYVDKTRFIRQIEQKGDFLFFFRPRRFGKSLFLSILDVYYSVLYKDLFEGLFRGTDIFANPTNEKNSYMVLKFNFSRIESNISQIEESFDVHVKNSCSIFIEEYYHLLEIDKDEVIKELGERKSASNILDSLLRYCKNKKYKVYVIIDEYDNFANTILTTAGEEKYRAITHGEGFLRAFFSVVKGGTTGFKAPVTRVFITGVSPITLDDVTSGFNIAENISLDDDINQLLGFTAPEVQDIIEYYRQAGKIHHSTPELMDIMSSWYNHYRFSLDEDTELFNPTQVFYFLKAYFKKSQVPIDLIDDNFRMDYHKLRHFLILDQNGTLKTNGNFSIIKNIIENGAIHATISKRFPVRNLTNPENFVSLLYFFGLLTIAGIDAMKETIFKIPNETVKKLYYEYIVETFAEVHAINLDFLKYSDLLADMAQEGNWRPVMEYLGELIDASTSLRDLIDAEKVLQFFFLIYLSFFSYFQVSTERELKKGFVDLLLEPNTRQFPNLKTTFLIELKYIKHSPDPIPEKTINDLKKEAEIQLNRYMNDARLKKSTGPGGLIPIVLIFSGYRLVYMG